VLKLDKAVVIELVRTDITSLRVDAIVNAANNSLLGGGGVDGAIHRAAGSKLLEECKGLNGCHTGEAKITGAYNLPSKFVIHTVGPVWKGGQQREAQLLQSAYRNCLLLAKKNGIETIAFPNISTGVYGYPKEAAAEIAIREIFDFLEKNPEIKKVIFTVFDEENYSIYNRLLN
jgi:O-acetyl-ADP-ribose deacetylase (regulator of RNase III)